MPRTILGLSELQARRTLGSIARHSAASRGPRLQRAELRPPAALGLSETASAFVTCMRPRDQPVGNS
jgi:hypothetical protein